MDCRCKLNLHLQSFLLIILNHKPNFAMSERIHLGRYLRSVLIIVDFVVLNLAYFLTLWILGNVTPFANEIVWFIVNLSLIPSEVFFSEIHNVRILYADKVVLNSFKSVVLAGGVMTAAFYTVDVVDIGLRHGIVFMALFFALLSTWWIISRRLLKKLRRMGLNFKRVVIVGAGQTGQMLYEQLQSDAGYGYRMMGFFDTFNSDERNAKGNYLASVDSLGEFIKLNKIDVIYYTLDADDQQTMYQVMRQAEEYGTSFIYVPRFTPVLSGQFELSAMGDMPILKSSVSPLHKSWNKLAKRVLDLMVSVPFLLVSPIIFIPIAIAIKLTSPGPVFFKQKRTGIRGREFVCYKFRTMKLNAESDKLQATKDDPRKTKLGDFLRKTSLDELPQFFNVLIGNMSVVGPRPHMVSHTEEYSALIEKYMIRHAVKPGITGWAQVNGYRGGTKYLWQMEKRVEHDVWYIRNWNIFLDIKIIFMTAFNGLREDKNAY